MGQKSEGYQSYRYLVLGFLQESQYDFVIQRSNTITKCLTKLEEHGAEARLVDSWVCGLLTVEFRHRNRASVCRGNQQGRQCGCVGGGQHLDFEADHIRGRLNRRTSTRVSRPLCGARVRYVRLRRHPALQARSAHQGEPECSTSHFAVAASLFGLSLKSKRAQPNLAHSVVVDERAESGAQAIARMRDADCRTKQSRFVVQSR